MAQLARRTAIIGSAIALASAGLLGTAVANGHNPHGPHGHHGQQTQGHGHGSKLEHTHLTLHATQAPTSTTGKYKSTVVGTLRAHKTPLVGETVSVEQRSKGGTWAGTNQSATTDSSGQVTFVFVQGAAKAQYRLVFAGDTTYRGSHSGTITIRAAKPAPATTPTPSASPTA